MPRYQDIKQVTQPGHYGVDVSWNYLAEYYRLQVVDYGLDVNPNFQRGNIWTETQKIRYVEYILRGGKSGKDIHTNAPNWHGVGMGREHKNGWYVLVDGKQRLDAVLGYLNNEFKVFGEWYHRDFTDGLDIIQQSFRWWVNELQTIEDVYTWYIDLNSGGTVHSDDEITRVRGLLEAGVPYDWPDEAETQSRARIDRGVIQTVIAKRAAEAAERAACPAPSSTTKPRRKARRR